LVQIQFHIRQVVVSRRYNTMDIEKGNSAKDASINEYSSLIPRENPEDDDDVLEDVPPWTLLEIAVSGFAAVTVATSIGALVITSNLFVMITALFGVLVPPYAAFQEQKITDIKAMDETSEVMTGELNNLKHENGRLEGENEKLKTSVASLQVLTEVFGEIREMENVSLDMLEGQLKESQQILDQMEDNKLDTVLLNIFDLMLAADEDADNQLSDKEISMLIKKVEGINNVEINDELCKKMIIEAGRGTEAIIKLARNVIDDDPLTGPQVGEKVFTIL